MSQQESNTSSSDFSYLFFRNGASFRIQYTDNDHDDLLLPRPTRLSKLTDLCCSIIVRHERLIELACETIPKALFHHLCRAALRYTQDDTAINILISRWPERVFRLEDFVDEKLTSLQMLLCEKTALQRTRQAIKYGVIIIPRFIDSMRQQQHVGERSSSRLRILDVTNFPVVELIIRYISTHCRLAEKESRRNQLIDIYHQQHQPSVAKTDDGDAALTTTEDSTNTCAGNSELAAQHEICIVDVDSENRMILANNHDDNLMKSSSYPDDVIIIRFDCIIQDYRTYVELLSALRASNPNIQLQICTIDMRCIGLALVSSFLDHVDPRVRHLSVSH